MEPEYASWRAKQAMLDRCDLGNVVILGDSRAAAGILPGRLPLLATNLAIGGGEPVEALSLLRRVLACPVRPRLVILSFDMGHFTHPDLFWERSVRFGMLSAGDIAALRTDSRDLADTALYDGRRADGTPAWLRDRLSLLRFPPDYAASLLRGGVFLRWPRNNRTLRETLAARGHYYFGTENGSDVVAYDGHMGGFRPSPVLDLYFTRMLRLLDQHGTEAAFVGMPLNQATWDAVDPANRARFAAYLAGFERGFPRFHVLPGLMPRWPDHYFGDPFCHLNPAGAERFSAGLARQLLDQAGAMRDE